jgi:hypothetical protein
LLGEIFEILIGAGCGKRVRGEGGDKHYGNESLHDRT